MKVRICRIYKSYKYRIYPNKQQQELIAKTFGCCRFVYNQVLEWKINSYELCGINRSWIDCNNYCNQVLKKEYKWLREPDKFALTNAIRDMNAAFQNFYSGRADYPRFKKKSNEQSYRTIYTNNNIEVDFQFNRIKIPKLRWVKAKISRQFEGKIVNATVRQVPSGKYFVSICVETEHEKLPSTGAMVGIDLGLKDLLITSDGQKFKNIHALAKHEKGLIKLQRRLSRKQKGSKNWNKARIKVAKKHEKIANIRLDYTHKITHKLISENQVIVSEKLIVQNMMQNHSLAKAISDVSWYELTRQLSYKAKWNNCQHVEIDTFFASSQLCNVCGFKNKLVKDLNVREWICPNCGAIHDRDINAAKNILNEGLRVIGLCD